VLVRNTAVARNALGGSGGTESFLRDGIRVSSSTTKLDRAVPALSTAQNSGITTGQPKFNCQPRPSLGPYGR
jgi:hypothetical protein